MLKLTATMGKSRLIFDVNSQQVFGHSINEIIEAESMTVTIAESEIDWDSKVQYILEALEERERPFSEESDAEGESDQKFNKPIKNVSQALNHVGFLKDLLWEKVPTMHLKISEEWKAGWRAHLLLDRQELLK